MDDIICLACNKASSYLVCESCMHTNNGSYDPEVLQVSWGLLCLSKCYKCCVTIEELSSSDNWKLHCIEVETQNDHSDGAYSELMVKSLNILGWSVNEKGRWYFPG